jgi:type VI secretion system protein ImpL
MRTFFMILLYLVIIILIVAICFGLAILLGRPLEEAVLASGLILATWLLIVLVRKAIIRYRARAQALRVLHQEHAQRDSDLGMSPKQLQKRLAKNWARAVKLLRKSHLKLRGDPLYVLPWYIVFGKPSSGKSTALKNARLLSPAMELSEHEEGSTLNLEWWLYDQAIILDTAGRYAVPDNDKRDRGEWNTLLKMLSRHKQKEPLNGLVLVVTADRLLANDTEALQAEGQQVRAGVNELMEELEIQMPVYLMVTKCDLVDQFANWCQYLPEESLGQAMGFLCEDEVGDIDAAIDMAFDRVLDRLKELRLLMMERGDYPDDSLIELPLNMEKMRAGLHAFAQTALKNNLFQETPRFRGLYFSSSQQTAGDGAEAGLANRGLFLHELFTRVMPPDRGLLSTLPSAERIRRAIRNYGLSISGATLALLIVVLTSTFLADHASLESVIEGHTDIDVVQEDINVQLNTLNRLNEIIEDVAKTEDEWTLPWYGPFIESPHQGRLRRIFLLSFKENLLDRLDERIAVTTNSALGNEQRAYLVSGIVRRINLIGARLDEDQEAFDALPGIPERYLPVVDPEVNQESSVLFDPLYQKYLQLLPSEVELADERLRLQSALEGVIASSRGDFKWLVRYTELQGFPRIKVGDFWSGSRQLLDEPTISSAYTLEGYEFIQNFLAELNVAGSDSASLGAVEENFMLFYQRNYLKVWTEFAEAFDYGRNKLRGRKEWQSAMESMTTPNNPYFAVMRRIQSEIEPVFSEGLFQARDEIDFFASIQEESGDEAAGGLSPKAEKAATKEALKVIGKFGKVGKLVAGTAKKGLKIKKKLGGKAEKLESQLEPAAAAYQAYKQSLKNLAFNVDAQKLSYDEVAHGFTNPDVPESGDGAGAQAWLAINDLQRVMGRPTQSSKLFWDLYTGPVRLAFDYMREEAACYLQSSWEDEVLAGLEGVSLDKRGETLIGETGLLWSYVDQSAGPFLKKKLSKGYISARVENQGLDWEPSFIEFVNNADHGRKIVAGEFVVKIGTLPTGINQSARISPFATYIDLHCADGVQTLANYNYYTSRDFNWALRTCGDTILRIELGEYSLRKQYLGQKGFSKFLAEFRDGRRIFTLQDFPDLASQLRNEKVQAIDVNYEISGQEPVIQMLEAVPLDPPYKVVSCWG